MDSSDAVTNNIKDVDLLEGGKTQNTEETVAVINPTRVDVSGYDSHLQKQEKVFQLPKTAPPADDVFQAKLKLGLKISDPSQDGSLATKDTSISTFELDQNSNNDNINDELQLKDDLHNHINGDMKPEFGASVAKEYTIGSWHTNTQDSNRRSHKTETVNTQNSGINKLVSNT